MTRWPTKDVSRKLMRAIKRAFDPKGILIAGKVRCAGRGVGASRPARTLFVY